MKAIARILPDKKLLLSGEIIENNLLPSNVQARFTSDNDLEIHEIIEEILMPSPTFDRNSIAYLSNGTQVNINQPRFEEGLFDKALLIEEGTTNLIQNPLFNGFTGWGSWNASVLTMEQIDFKGTLISALRLTARDVGYSNAIYQTIPTTDGQEYTFSFYAKKASPGTGQIRAYINEYVSFNINSEDWTRIELTQVCGVNAQLHITQASTDYDVYIAFPQFEAKPYATSFTTGSRSAETFTIPMSEIYNSEEGTWEQWVYVNSIAKRQLPNQYNTIFNAIGVGNLTLKHFPTGPQWYVASNDGVNPTVYIFVDDSLTPDGWHLFIVRWTKQKLSLFIDGIEVGSVNNPKLPQSLSQAYIGGEQYGNWLNTLHGNLRISSIARTDKEILEAYQSNKPLPVDAYTTYKLNFNDTILPSKNVTALQIKDGKLYVPEFTEGVDL